MSCLNCGSPFHEIWICPKPRKESREGERIGAQAVHGSSGGDAVQLGVSAVSNKPSLDTNSGQLGSPAGGKRKPEPLEKTEQGNLVIGKRRGRPQTIDDMKAYKAEKAKEYRARKKEGK